MQLFAHFQTSKLGKWTIANPVPGFQTCRHENLAIFSTFVPAFSRLSLSGEDQDGGGRLAGSGREKGEVMIKYPQLRLPAIFPTARR